MQKWEHSFMQKEGGGSSGQGERRGVVRKGKTGGKKRKEG